MTVHHHSSLIIHPILQQKGIVDNNCIVPLLITVCYLLANRLCKISFRPIGCLKVALETLRSFSSWEQKPPNPRSLLDNYVVIKRGWRAIFHSDMWREKLFGWKKGFGYHTFGIVERLLWALICTNQIWKHLEIDKVMAVGVSGGLFSIVGWKNDLVFILLVL
jgi:hypothetical protein